MFLDMLNYLASGCSYAYYLKAFTKDEWNGCFPYKWMTSIRKQKNLFLSPLRSVKVNSLSYHYSADKSMISYGN